MATVTDRQSKGFQLATILGTILTAPQNYSILIYGFRYALPGAFVGTITAEIKASTLGTITGTLDVVTLNNPNAPLVRDPGASDIAVARLEGGQSAVGVVTSPVGATASLEGVLIYAYAPGRVVGA